MLYLIHSLVLSPSLSVLVAHSLHSNEALSESVSVCLLFAFYLI